MRLVPLKEPAREREEPEMSSKAQLREQRLVPARTPIPHSDERCRR